MKSITTKNIKIPKIQDFDNNYIENYLAKTNYKIIRWAITYIDDINITLTVSYAE